MKSERARLAARMDLSIMSAVTSGVCLLNVVVGPYFGINPTPAIGAITGFYLGSAAYYWRRLYR